MTKEEAIKEAYGIPVNKKQHEALQILIPELKESEGERIRKVLVDMVKRETGFTGFPSQGQVLAYLEKQKEPENVSASTMIPSCWEEEQEEQEPAEYTHESALQKIKRTITDCKKLSGHYKDTEENFYQYYGGKAEGLQLALTFLGNENEQPQKEQKPAEWSGEDELMRTAVIQTLETFGGRGTTEMQIAWLKSLKPQRR